VGTNTGGTIRSSTPSSPPAIAAENVLHPGPDPDRGPGSAPALLLLRVSGVLAAEDADDDQ